MPGIASYTQATILLVHDNSTNATISTSTIQGPDFPVEDPGAITVVAGTVTTEDGAESISLYDPKVLDRAHIQLARSKHLSHILHCYKRLYQADGCSSIRNSYQRDVRTEFCLTCLSHMRYTTAKKR